MYAHIERWGLFSIIALLISSNLTSLYLYRSTCHERQGKSTTVQSLYKSPVSFSPLLLYGMLPGSVTEESVNCNYTSENLLFTMVGNVLSINIAIFHRLISPAYNLILSPILPPLFIRYHNLRL